MIKKTNEQPSKSYVIIVVDVLFFSEKTRPNFIYLF